MITGTQILCHLIGDYLLQNSWMALNKTTRWIPAMVHACFYSIPFLFITGISWSIPVICVTHCIIDRFRLPKYFIWAVNGFKGKITLTGYSKETPDWLSTWLLIIVDNTWHLLINGLAINYIS